MVGNQMSLCFDCTVFTADGRVISLCRAPLLPTENKLAENCSVRVQSKLFATMAADSVQGGNHQAPTNMLHSMGLLPKFEMITDGKMANVYEQSKVVDNFGVNFGYKYGLKSLRMGVNPNHILDVIRNTLKAWASQRLAVMGTLQIFKYHRILKKMRTHIKQKQLRRRHQIMEVVKQWESHELSQRALLASGLSLACSAGWRSSEVFVRMHRPRFTHVCFSQFFLGIFFGLGVRVSVHLSHVGTTVS